MGACDLEGEARDAYLEQACTEDPTLRDLVEVLLARDAIADHAIDLVGSIGRSRARPALPESIGPYRILRGLAHGGMSDVYLGCRETETRQVAIKVLRRGFETAKALARFELEGCVLDTLKHPNIAQFLDAGETRDGRPYIAMEFIQGAPIDEYCDRHRLSTTERLALFCTVCRAVHHAHCRLVVHRDLKPSNIIVQDDGTPKLLDFGIAKLIDPELVVVAGEPTGPTQRMLSPQYASPEQVRGEPVTTASDTYSLGVLLYEIVSGSRPYQLSREFGPADLHRVVCEMEPIEPSAAVRGAADVTREGSLDRLRRRLRGDIDTIALVALRKDPARRYDTVEQLSQDIRRHLEGRPIIARRDTLRYRSEKYLQRHKVGVAVVLCAAVTVAASLAVVWQSTRARAADERARELAGQVGSFAQLVLGEVNDELTRLGASLAARQALAAESLKYLNGVARDAGENIELNRQLALAYDRLGEIQGSRDLALGDASGALESFQMASRLRAPVLAALPDDAEILGAVAQNRLNTGVELYFTGRMEESRTAYREAAAIHERLTEHDSTWRAAEFCSVLLREVLMLRREGRLVDAELACAEAISIAKGILRESASDAALLSELSRLHLHAGTIQWVMGRTNAAIDACNRGIAISEELLDLDPEDTRWRFRMGTHRLILAELHAAIGQPDEALEQLERVFSVYGELTARNPDASTLRHSLSHAHWTTGCARLGRAEWELARTSFETGQSIATQLMAAHTDNLQYRGMLLNTVEGLSDAAKGAGDPERAMVFCEHAIRLARQLEQADPGNPWWPRRKFGLFRKAGVLDALMGDRDGSRARLAHAWNGFASLADSHRLTEILIDGLVSSYQELTRLEDGPAGIVDVCDRTVSIVAQSAAAYHDAGYHDRAIETAKEALRVSRECRAHGDRRAELEGLVEQYRAKGGT